MSIVDYGIFTEAQLIWPSINLFARLPFKYLRVPGKPPLDHYYPDKAPFHLEKVKQPSPGQTAWPMSILELTFHAPPRTAMVKAANVVTAVHLVAIKASV